MMRMSSLVMASAASNLDVRERAMAGLLSMLNLIGGVRLGRVIDARVIDDTSAKAFDCADICQELYTAGGRPRLWIDLAVHCDIGQVCEGDDVADGTAVDQRRSNPDSQAGEREAFNGGIQGDCC